MCRDLWLCCSEDSLPVEGIVESDESYFGGFAKADAGKAPVFGTLKRGGKLYDPMSARIRSCPYSAEDCA